MLIPSKAYIKWHKIALADLKYQMLKVRSKIEFPIKQCKEISVYLTYGDRRGADNSNKIESIHDLLVDAGALIDDKWVVTGGTHQIPLFKARSPSTEIDIRLDEKLYTSERTPDSFPDIRTE